jgi:hypothetical protein
VGAILFNAANGYIAGESMFPKKNVEDGKVISEVSDVGKHFPFPAHDFITPAVVSSTLEDNRKIGLGPLTILEMKKQEDWSSLNNKD